MPRQLGHHEGAVLGQDNCGEGMGALIQVIISCWQVCLCWIHRVQQWKISEHTGKPQQFTDSLLDGRQALLSLFLPISSYLSVCIWLSGLRYCQGCFPPCLLMMWMVRLPDRWCLDAGLLTAKTRLWAAKLKTLKPLLFKKNQTQTKQKKSTGTKTPEFWKFFLEKRLSCCIKSLLFWGKKKS